MAEESVEKGWDEDISEWPEEGYVSIAEAVRNLGRSKEGREQEDYEWLWQVLHMSWQSGGANAKEDRYGPYYAMDGRRSMSEEDIQGTEDGERIIRYAEGAQNTWIKHRLGDIAWRMVQRREMPKSWKRRAVEVGKEAARAAMRLDIYNVCVEGQDALLRASEITKSIGDRRLREELREHCKRILGKAEREEGGEPRPWMVDAAQQGLARIGVGSEERVEITEQIMRIAGKWSRAVEDSPWTEGMWMTGIEWARKAQRIDLERDGSWGLGMEIKKRGDRQQGDNALGLTVIYGDAIAHLEDGAKGERNSGRKKELQEIRRQQYKYAERVKGGEGMTTIEIPFPEDGRERAEEWREGLRGKSLVCKMTTLAMLSDRPQSKEEYEGSGSETQGGLGLLAWEVGMEEGRIIQKGGETKGRMTQEGMKKFNLYTDLVIKLKIIPGLVALIEEHEGQEEIEEWIRIVCERSTWVPEGQRESWIEGLVAGTQEQWRTCLEKLLPRVEGALRELNKKQGGGELRGQGKDERDLMMGELLEPEVCRTLISMEWRNEILAAVVGQGGWNLRHNHCHGKMEDAQYGTLQGYYFWWLMLHFTVSGAWIPDLPLRSPTEEEIKAVAQDG